MSKFRIATVLAIGVLAGMSTAASSAMLTGFTTAPNWAFGNPQTPFINGCLDTDPGGGSCFGHFGLGALSDVLDYRNVGQVTTIETSYADTAGAPPAANVFGRRETAYEKNGDWWNLTIPTARWVGFGANGGVIYFLRDGGDPAGVFGDEIGYINVNGAAHLMFASNNSDTPDPSLPDFTQGFPATSFFDVFVDISTTGGVGAPDTFTQDTLNNARSLPTDQQCTPSVDTGCVADDPTQTLPTFIPEPSSLVLLGGGLLGLALSRRPRRSSARRGDRLA